MLYLDAKEKKHIDECGAANFFGIRDGRYITPKSHSVLPSITNMSLMTLAADLGLKVESRPVEAEELSTFSEAGACGTAAVISPIGSIYDPETNHTYTYNNGEPGEWSKKLYHKLRAIQYGEEPDTHGWNLVLEYSGSFSRIVPARGAEQEDSENRYVAAHRKGAPFFLSVATRSGSGFGCYFCRCLGQDLRGDTARGLRMACSLLRSRWNSPRGKLSLFL